VRRITRGFFGGRLVFWETKDNPEDVLAGVISFRRIKVSKTTVFAAMIDDLRVVVFIADVLPAPRN
jgi:hypothetical protein